MPTRTSFKKGHSGLWKGKKGENSAHWRGGKPKCKDCNKQLGAYKAKRCPSCAKRGPLNYGWKNDARLANHRIRNSPEYKLWRKAVFERDNYTCVWCGIKGNQTGGYLNADHIKPFSLFPELRFALDNGRTLCKPCHRKTDTYGNRIKR